MKKLLLAFVLLLSLTLLFSCKIGGDDSGDTGSGGSSDTGSGDGTGAGGSGGLDNSKPILLSGTEVSIVTDGTVDSAAVQRLSAAVEKITGKRPVLVTVKADGTGDNSAVNSPKTEIVIGDLGRGVSDKAKGALEKAYRRALRHSEDGWEHAEKDLALYGVYSDGQSVALAYTSDYFTESSVDYFIDKYLFSDSLSLPEGYIKTNEISKEEYLEDRGEKIKAAAWETLAEQIPAEYSKKIIEALKVYYTLYSTKTVDWLANLYDPAVGGFYYSNSARDNHGYLPDIESTVEALEFISASGMAEMYGGSWALATPEWLHEQVGQWVYNLQDENTFFYHPQWTKEFIAEKGLDSRITRDQGSALRILRPLGITPKYAVVDREASYSGNLTSRLSGGGAVAVSKVVAVESTLPQYASVAAFKQHLAKMEASLAGLSDEQFANQFYSWGNTFQTGYKQMNTEMKKLLIDFFNKYQNPKTGLWCEELSYTSTDGMHKLGAVYNAIGATVGQYAELKYTDRMVESALKILTDTSIQAEAAVDIYNAVSGFAYVYDNINKFGSGTAEDKAEKIEGYKAKVYEYMPTIINNGTAQYRNFAYTDGSFSYNLAKVGQGGTAQGCPVAIVGTKEGDVNGTSTAMIAFVSYVLGAIEVDTKYMVPIYTEAERYRFVSILEELGAVLKNEAQVVDPFTYDFEDAENEYDISPDLGLNKRDSDVIIEKEENGNSRLAITSYPWYKLEGYSTAKRNGNLNVKPVSVSKNDSVGVVEFDIAFDEITQETDGSFLINFGTNTAYFASYYVKLCKEGRFYYAYFRDGDGNDLGIRLPAANVTLKLRFEYYRAESVFKIYANGEFLTESTAMTSKGNNFEKVTFEFNASAQMKVFFDNLIVQKEYIKYKEATEEGKAPSFDEPVLGRPVYDFESASSNKDYPRGLEVTENSGSVDILGALRKKKLEITGSRFDGHKNPEVSLYCYTPDTAANAYVFSADLAATYDSEWAIWRNIGKLSFSDSDGNGVITLLLRAKRSGGVTQICITDKTALGNPLITFNSGSSLNLKAVYFPENSEILVFVNGAFVTSYKNSTATAAIDRMTVSIDTGIGMKLSVDNLALTGETLDYNATVKWPDVADGLGKPAPEFPWISGDSGAPDSGDASEDMDNSGFTPTDNPTEKVEPVEPPPPPTEPDDGGEGDDSGNTGGDNTGGDDSGNTGGDNTGSGDSGNTGGSGGIIPDDNGEYLGGGYHAGAWS